MRNSAISSPILRTSWRRDSASSFLPAFMSVIVTSSSSQTDSQISGNTVHIVVVQTNADYAPAVGHDGTGTVVAQIC